MTTPMTRLSGQLVPYVAAVLLLSQVGCSTAHYKESADREAYGIIQAKSPLVPNMDAEFTIERPPVPELEGLPKVLEAEDALGEEKDTIVGASIVSLEKALELAVRYNRNYLNQKEVLYLSALALTLDRYQFTPIFSGGVDGSYNRLTTDRQRLSPLGQFAAGAPEVFQEIGGLIGTPADLIDAYSTIVTQATALSGADTPSTEIMNERSVDGRTNLGVDWLLKGGGRIAVDLTSNFLRFLTGDDRVSTSSALVGSFTQPLLRGAGSKVAAERLTQAERDVLYAIRDFTRFRQVFTVSIVSQYYNTLRARDVMQNNYLNYVAFKESAERDRAMVEEGRSTQSDLGRIQQAELNANSAWTSSIRQYKQSLDDFKIQLGLPVDTHLVLDSTELDRLHERGIQHWTVPAEDAAKVALYARLDLYNTHDELEDAARRVEIAANSLLPDLNLQLASTVNSMPGADRFQELDFQRARWSAALDFELPLDRKAERNNYRSALITLERTDRALQLAIDEVKLDVRDAARNLEEAAINYQIRLLGVQINESRVEEETLRKEIGEGDALNLVDAQNDLTSARNDLTAALISHTIARLSYWRDMGILYIREHGQWSEITESDLPIPPDDAPAMDTPPAPTKEMAAVQSDPQPSQEAPAS